MNPPAVPKAIFLDLDDTIIDDSSSVDTGWTAACQEATDTTPDLNPIHLKATIFTVRDWYWADPERARTGRQDLRAASAWIVEESLHRLSIEVPGLGTSIANRYRDLREQSIDLLPGALAAIESFHAAGIRLALLTNGASVGQRAKIDRFDLARHFAHIGIEGELGYGKPDKRVYLHALDALGARPDQTWMVGDNMESDVMAPMRLGLKGIRLDRFQTGVPQGTSPDRVILRLDELI